MIARLPYTALRCGPESPATGRRSHVSILICCVSAQHCRDERSPDFRGCGGRLGLHELDIQSDGDLVFKELEPLIRERSVKKSNSCLLMSRPRLGIRSVANDQKRLQKRPSTTDGLIRFTRQPSNLEPRSQSSVRFNA